VRTEELIVKLAGEAAPVRPVPPFGLRFGGWLAVAAVAGVVAVSVAGGVRADLIARLSEKAYLLPLLFLLLGTVSAGASALTLSVPGGAGSALGRWLPYAAVTGWGAWLAAGLASGGPAIGQLIGEPGHSSCLVLMSATAAVPAVVLLSRVRRAAPLDAGWSGALAVLAAAGVGAVGAAVVCPIDRSAHQVIWHVLPVVALAAAGPIVGVLWLDRLRSLSRG
jgi:hypothetical protein